MHFDMCIRTAQKINAFLKLAPQMSSFHVSKPIADLQQDNFEIMKYIID